jgi:hypothetical protein
VKRFLKRVTHHPLSLFSSSGYRGFEIHKGPNLKEHLGRIPPRVTFLSSLVFLAAQMLLMKPEPGRMIGDSRQDKRNRSSTGVC